MTALSVVSFMNDIGHLAAVAQDRGRLADAEYLVHLVRDVDDRDALCRQLGR